MCGWGVTKPRRRSTRQIVDTEGTDPRRALKWWWIVSSFHPDQPTRLRVSWGLDDPTTDVAEVVTAGFALRHLKTATNTAKPVGGDLVEMKGHDFLPLPNDEQVIADYLCGFTIRPLGRASRL